MNLTAIDQHNYYLIPTVKQEYFRANKKISHSQQVLTAKIRWMKLIPLDWPTPVAALKERGIRLTEDANQTLDRPSTRGHDETRSEDGDPLKNLEQRTQETILITLPITI